MCGVSKSAVVGGGCKVSPPPCGLDAIYNSPPEDIAAQWQAGRFFKQVQKAALGKSREAGEGRRARWRIGGGGEG